MGDRQVHRRRVAGTLPVGPTWTHKELQHELAKRDLAREHSVQIPVSLADLDPQLARKRQLQRRRWFAFLIVLIGAVATYFVVKTGHRPWSSLVGPAVFSLIYWSTLFQQRRRIRSIAPENSAAETFVRALTDATSELRGVRQHWLVFTVPGDATLVAQEEQWGYQGVKPVLAVRWENDGNVLVGVRAAGNWRRHLVQFNFADKSSVLLDIGRSGQRALLDNWPGQ